jgi:hypothetical protein
MLALLLESAMVAPPAGAGADKVMVQLADPGAATDAGEQLTVDGTTTTVKPIEADRCWPL